MASSSERSPPPFPDSEDQDLLESEEVGAEDSDEEGSDIFLGVSNSPVTITDTALPTENQHSVVSTELPTDIMDDPLSEPVSQSASKPFSEPLDDFVDLTSNEANSEVLAESAVEEAGKGLTKMPLDETTDDFVDLLENETESPATNKVPVSLTGDTKTGSKAEQEPKESSHVPVIDIGSVMPANNSKLPPATVDPLVDISNATPAGVNKPSQPSVDLFRDDPGDWFQGPQQAKSVKQPSSSLFGEPDEDLFEPLGATSKKSTAVVSEKRDKVVASKSGSGDVSGPLNDNYPGEPSDIFTEEALITAPIIVNSSTANSKTNGVHSEEEADIFAEATVELSLDSPLNERKKNIMAKPAVSTTPTLAAAASLSKPQSVSPMELEEEEEAEVEDKFEINISITNPEKIGDGMNAYMAYKVSTQTTLPMFRNKTFTVRRRFSDFLGLYEKLSEKHAPGGYIVPPPPEKSILGMTKVKVGKEDPSSAEFVERRRAALERYLQRVVCHPSLLQDPDVREFLEREELPRAVNTQALSGAGFLKMINKATDAVSKMTIKMNESDVWFEEKLQEVESADQQFRKLLGLVESLVGHRKELSLNTAGFAKSIAMLGSSEDNTALSRALSQLAEVEDKMEQLHQEQASSDSFNFAELLADYIRLLGAVRASFDHRMKAWQRWQDAQTTLQKKRESEAKLLWANKPDKLQLAKDEITEWEAKVTQYERDFDRVSATVRKEVVRFEKERTRNFKRQIIKYLESLLQCQQRLIKYWEAFLPEAKAIV